MSGVPPTAEKDMRDLCTTCPLSAVCAPLGPMRLLEKRALFRCERCGRKFWAVGFGAFPACGLITKSVLSCGRSACDAELAGLRRNVREAQDKM